MTVKQREQFFLPVPDALREAERLVAEGEEQAKRGETEAAIASFQKALELEPKLGINPESKALTLKGRK